MSSDWLIDWLIDWQGSCLSHNKGWDEGNTLQRLQVILHWITKRMSHIRDCTISVLSFSPPPIWLTNWVNPYPNRINIHIHLHCRQMLICFHGNILVDDGSQYGCRLLVSIQHFGQEITCSFLRFLHGYCDCFTKGVGKFVTFFSEDVVCQSRVLMGSFRKNYDYLIL